MKWALIVIASLVGLVVLMALVGALLPRAHVAASAVTLRQPPDTLWRTMRDLGGLTTWLPQMKESNRGTDPAGREVWDQKTKDGWAMRMIVTEDIPPTRFVTTIDSTPGAAFGGSWTYEIAATPDGSRVTVTERGWIANPIFRFLARFVFGYHGSLDDYLTALGRKFGEDARPTHQ